MLRMLTGNILDREIRMRYALKQVCQVLNGRAYKQEELLSSGKYRVLRVGNFFSSDRWYYSDMELDDNKYCNNGDLLFAWSATFGPRIWDGEKAIYHYHIWKMVPNERFVDKNYLYYWLMKNVSNLTAGVHGSVMGHITKNEMENFEIDLPNLNIQRKIASVLDSIDNKIKENMAINKNLQHQARTLYKAWFEDLVPFHGQVPANWKTGKLKDVLQLKRNATKAGQNQELPYLPIDVIPMNTFALSEVKPNEDAQSSLITFDRDDIVVGAMRIYFHRVVLAPFPGITRTTCFTLAPYDGDYLSFSLLCCDQDSTIEYAQTTSKGSTMPYAVWDGGLGDMGITIPDKETAHNFNELVLPMLRHIQASFSENRNLKGLRDSLLPKLMSGEIDVSDLSI